jgi:oxygen-independent coproporphyrinogen III oxidase
MHVYVHVPFCARRCSYCDFAIAVRREVPSEAYLQALLEEWGLWQAAPVWNHSPAIETIYLGGGTPSRLAPAAVASLLDAIASDRPVRAHAEITLEANPDDVTPAAAKAWMTAGVNRISLGAQTFDPSVLRWMHRTHTAAQTSLAVEALRAAGIQNLSLDLIFGLPAELGRDWARDLDLALALEPEHLSLYGLTVEPHTPLGRWTERGEVAPISEHRYAQEFLDAHAALISRGYEHYEVSNAARPGYRARHNAAYWRRAPFIGLGPAAHSGFGQERRWNVKDWSAYQRLLAQGRSPMEGRELLDQEAGVLEELYLGLRTSEGVRQQLLQPGLAELWQRSGWAEIGADRVTLTPEGWLRLDALVGSGVLVQR